MFDNIGDPCLSVVHSFVDTGNHSIIEHNAVHFHPTFSASFTLKKFLIFSRQNSNKRTKPENEEK